MTLPVNPNRVSYSANGTITAFAFPYRFFDEADLKVMLRSSGGDETSLTLDTDFSVSGADEDSGGTVSLITAPDSSQTVIIYRDVDLEQELDMQDLSAFPAEEVEREFDRQVAMAQRMDERLDRALVLSDADTSVTQTIPLLADRTGQFLGWDSSGRVIAGQPTDLTVVTTAFSQGLLDDANAAAALTTLGLSPLAQLLSDDTDASQHLGTLGFSTLAKNLCDDTDASMHFTTLGIQAALIQAICSTNTTLSRAGFTGIDQTHSVVSSGSNGHGSGSNKVRRFTTNTATGTAISVASDSTLGTVFTINEPGLYAIQYQDAASAAFENIAITLDATGGDLTANVGTSGVNRLAFAHCNTATVANVFAVAHLATSQKLRAQDAGSCDSTFTQFRIHRIGN